MIKELLWWRKQRLEKEAKIKVLEDAGFDTGAHTIKDLLNRPGCPGCGSQNYTVENQANGAYVPWAKCKDCGNEGNVEIGSKWDPIYGEEEK